MNNNKNESTCLPLVFDHIEAAVKKKLDANASVDFRTKSDNPFNDLLNDLVFQRDLLQDRVFAYRAVNSDRQAFRDAEDAYIRENVQFLVDKINALNEALLKLKDSK